MLDYLAAIYTLSQDFNRSVQKVTTTILAEKMHVSPAAASSMLKRLEESGFVDRSDTEGVILTEQGRLAALQLLRRHRLLEVFLIEIMGFTWDQVDVEAHRLEFEERMDHLCGYPTHCPHGDAIPSKNGDMPNENLISVLEMKPGQTGVLRRIGTNDARVLRYLSQLKLTPGRMIRLIEKAPFKGPITLELGANGMHPDDARPGDASHIVSAVEDAVRKRSHSSQILGNELAEQLFVVSLDADETSMQKSDQLAP
jgi:DtxR family Mn-dependent transcriptional regulator